MMVVLHHFTSISRPFEALFDFGRVGVLLFFLISGYCITLTLNQPSNRPMVSFWLRRILRLYPPYWATVALVALIGTETFPPSVWLANLTMLQQGLRQPDVLGVFWSLFLELLFYALATALGPLAVFHNQRRLMAVWLALMGISVCFAVAKYRFGLPLPFSYPLFLCMFFAGSLMRHLDEVDISWPPAPLAAALAGGLGVVWAISQVVFTAPIGGMTALAHFGNHLVAIAAFLAFRWLRPGPRWLTFLGEISYSLYLVHVVVGNRIPGDGMLAMLARLAAGLVVAWILHVALERPCMALGRRLAAGLTRPAPASAA